MGIVVKFKDTKVAPDMVDTKLGGRMAATSMDMEDTIDLGSFVRTMVAKMEDIADIKVEETCTITTTTIVSVTTTVTIVVDSKVIVVMKLWVTRLALVH